ncbi:HAD hydrolase-like protein, partial [Paenirhodobacter enshiensis]|uniref:HAD hydrolase-like protein n=1 Tax=Paenirhodobacter enshiensis TaxID=1105367 RepID=UPI003FA2A21B
AAMVGDTPHDMAAARAAGTGAVAVLTGPNPRAVLEPVADAVLGSIGELGGWLDRQDATGRR